MGIEISRILYTRKGSIQWGRWGGGGGGGGGEASPPKAPASPPPPKGFVTAPQLTNIFLSQFLCYYTIFAFILHEKSI